MPPANAHINVRIVRLLVAVGGSYAFTSGYVAVLGSGLSRLGLSPVNAVTTGVMTAVPVFLALAIWAVATRRLLRTTLFILGGAFLLTFAAPLLAGR